jgi:uncharacterized membrane protein YkvA (DUF1232 family)
MSKTQSPGNHDESINRVNANAGDISSKFVKQKALRSLMDNGLLMIDFVRDYSSGRYREIPYWAVSAAALSLIYVLSPVDLVPDFIVGAGFLDDAAVVAFSLRLIEAELAKYKEWKDRQIANVQTVKPALTSKVVDV